MVNERRKQEEAVKQDHHTMVGLESMLASLLPTTVDVVLFLDSSWSKADVDNALLGNHWWDNSYDCFFNKLCFMTSKDFSKHCNIRMFASWQTSKRKTWRNLRPFWTSQGSLGPWRRSSTIESKIGRNITYKVHSSERAWAQNFGGLTCW